MSRVTRHSDDFELLRYSVGELSDAEGMVVLQHIERCERCLLSLTELRSLDSGLREIAGGDAARSPDDDLPLDDPFHARPERRPSRRTTRDLADAAFESSHRATEEVDGFIDAVAGPSETFRRYLAALAFADPAARYLLLFGLDEASRRVGDGPGRYLRAAEAALDRLGKESADNEPAPDDAELLVPLGTLIAQAHSLAGQAAVWTGELDKARRHFEESYRTFYWENESDEIRLAMVEFHESQRRSFAGMPAQGLALARRARRTFDGFGMLDYSARTRVAEGIALSGLDRDDAAAACYRSALPVFESQGLWTNYCSAVNSLAFSLARLGRLDEARRELSRSLRIVSRDQHPSLLAFCRQGLARVLFIARHYDDAAKSFAQAAGLFEELEQTGDVLCATLWEIESWARSGDIARARHRLEIFRARVARVEPLDRFIVGQLEEVLSGRDPDLEEVAALRERLESTIRDSLQATSG